MSMEHVIEVRSAELFNTVWARKQEGCRFITITCLDNGAGHTVFYHFDRGYQMVHVKIELQPAEPLRSISGLYVAATLAENELQDMFGITVHGLAIDYRGKLLLAEGAPAAPLSKAPLCVPLADQDRTGRNKEKCS